LYAIVVGVREGIAGIADTVVIDIRLRHVANFDAVICIISDVSQWFGNILNGVRAVSESVSIDITIVTARGKTFVNRTVAVVVDAIKFFLGTREDTAVVVVAVVRAFDIAVKLFQ
jgi:hypothetical protein